MIHVSSQEARKLGLIEKASRKDKEARRAANDAFAKLFLAGCREHGLPVPDQEYKFCETRNWKADWIFGGDLIVEIEGNPFAGGKCKLCGLWKGGRHQIGKGYLEDMAKYNEMTILGFSLIRGTRADVESGAIFSVIKRALEGE